MIKKPKKNKKALKKYFLLAENRLYKKIVNIPIKAGIK